MASPNRSQRPKPNPRREENYNRGDGGRSAIEAWNQDSAGNFRVTDIDKSTRKKFLGLFSIPKRKNPSPGFGGEGAYKTRVNSRGEDPNRTIAPAPTQKEEGGAPQSMGIRRPTRGGAGQETRGRQMRTCGECGGQIPRSRHPLTTVCSEACKKTRHLRHSKEHYERNAEKILKKRKGYQEQWRQKNPEYHRKWREANPEYHPSINRSWHHKLTSDLVPRVQAILSRCSQERAERICWDILHSTQPRWQRFKRSYAGDDILGSYIE